MNISKKWAALLSRLCDAGWCSPARIKSQAARASRVTPREDAISVAIAHYNRGRLAHRPLCNLLNNPLVGEVVFFDDGSAPEELDWLKDFVGSLGLTEKIRIECRERNLGAQATKLDAVAACRNEWVLVLDSDNTAFANYLRELGKIPHRDPETIYCSPFAFPYFSFQSLAGRRLDFDACTQLTIEGVLRRVFIINDGNYLVHRSNYIERLGRLKTVRSDAADVIMANYLWLSTGGNLQVLERGCYHHRVEDSSFWLRTAEVSRGRMMELYERLAQGQRWDDQFAAQMTGK